MIGSDNSIFIIVSQVQFWYRVIGKKYKPEEKLLSPNELVYIPVIQVGIGLFPAKIERGFIFNS